MLKTEARAWVQVLIGVLVISLVILSFPALFARAYSPALAEGKKLPDITLEDGDGNSVKLAPKDGRMLYVLYWNDIIHGLNDKNYGRIALTALNSLAEEYNAKGVDIVVVHDGRFQEVEEWVNHMDFQFEVLWDVQKVIDTVAERNMTAGIGVDSQGIVRVFRYAWGREALHSRLLLQQDLAILTLWPEPDPRDWEPVLLPIGATVPDFSLRDFENLEFDMATYIGESPVCIVFWSPECSYSTSTMYRLKELYPEFNARGIEFIAIDDSTTTVLETRRWLGSNFMPFISLRDEFGSLRERFGLFGSPTMVVADKNGVITFSGKGNAIHEVDLRPVLEAVAGPSLHGGWPGQPGSDPLHDLEPLVVMSGDFDGLKLFCDPLLDSDRVAALAAGLRDSLDDLYEQLGVDKTVFAGTDSQLTFYADPMRYFNDGGAGCTSIGYCYVDLDQGPFIRMYVQWTTDLETTLIVAKHELVHALLKLRTKQVPPLWFDEGCADAFSRPQSAEAFTLIANLDRRPSAAVVEEWWSDQRYNSDAREIGHGVLDYILHQYGQEGFQKLLDAMAAGNHLEQAVQKGLGVSFSRFWDDFWADVPAAAERSWAKIVTEHRFDDIPCDEYGDFGLYQVNFLANLGVIGGSGNFNPRLNLTRAQFAELAVHTLALPSELAQRVVFPTSDIKRYEAAAMLIMALGLPTSSPPEDWEYFADQELMPEWAVDYVWTAVVHGLIDRYLLSSEDGEIFWNEDKDVYIDRPVTRVEGAVFIARAYNLRLTLLDPPVSKTLNTKAQEELYSDSNGDEENGSPTVPGSWIWVLAGGGIVVLLGLAAWFFAVRHRKAKISA